MKIRYTAHAKERLRERGIKKSEIEEAVINGQKREVQSNGSILCKYTKGGKELILIYWQEKDKYKIITAYRN